MLRKIPWRWSAPKSTSIASTMWREASLRMVMSAAKRVITHPSSADTYWADAAKTMRAASSVLRITGARLRRSQGGGEERGEAEEREECRDVGDRREHDRR